jgi:hypothetical protein
MTAIYLDLSALRLPSLDPAVPEEQLAPGVAEAVGHLLEAGFAVVIVAPEDAPMPSLGEGVTRADMLPEHLDAGSWFLTGEPYPALGRPRGGLTMLVGPRPPAGKVPLPRFDLEARDLPAAAMEILTHEAMA